MTKTDVLILGAGLSGLSTAYHLDRAGGKGSYLIAEKDSAPGGLSGSVRQDGFTFDYTGHLLHLHDPYCKRLITRLLAGNLALHQRSSWVYSHGVHTRYPFQANTFGLPSKVVEDCVAGFLKTVHRSLPVLPDLSFQEWCLRVFGNGISGHFMFPYNEKLWRAPLSCMTTDWQGRFVPKPAPEEVLYGALTDQKKFFGYNAAFRYPVRGGIQVLPDALARRVSNLQLGCRVTAVDLRGKTARIDGLGEVSYRRLVNTLPLTDFLDLAAPLPEAVRDAGKKLRYVSVYNLNLGVARKRVFHKHWIYFPEKKYPFYRVGFLGNFSSHAGPKDSDSLYVEASHGPDERVDARSLDRGILGGLKACGILRSSDKLLAKRSLPIRCAYVLYDFNRAPALRKIFPFLRSRGVESIGRYGAWKYSFMEEAILDGKRCAERLLGRASCATDRSEPRPQSELKPLR